MNIPRAIQNFPKAYRAKEMRVLARWLRAGESGSVVGLPGCGRNNLLNFLCYRPDALREEYLGAEADHIVVIPVDLSHLPTNDAATLYRVVLRAFYWLRHQLPSTLPETVASLYLENRATQDPFLAQSALYEMLLGFRTEGVRAALVLNRFDHFCQDADPRLFALLRSLRDSFKEILALIVGLHRDIIYLPGRQALGDLYPVLDNNVCWIGAMSEADSRWVIELTLHAAPELPSEPEIEQILTLSGGFPVLLRFITSWWVHQTPKPPLDQWLTVLLEEPLFGHRLKELWQGLTQEEQAVLALVVGERKKVLAQLKQEYRQILSRLVTKGVCCQTDQGWQMNSALWAAFVRRQGVSPGKLAPNQKTGVISQGSKSLKLSPQESTLLGYLLNDPFERHTYENLIQEIWPNDHDPQTQKPALYQLARSIRLKIEPEPGRPRYLVTWANQDDGGYQLFPEGQPL